MAQFFDRLAVEQSPTSTKPYLVRAIHEWCTDNGLTPYLAVAVNERVRVPKEHVRDGEIVLNIGMLATDKLQIGNEEITFQARFSGRIHQIVVPMDRVIAVYAKETNNGMAFDVLREQQTEPAQTLQSVQSAESMESAAPDDSPPPAPSPTGGRPKLTRVK